jgi:hypothetical protein
MSCMLVPCCGEFAGRQGATKHCSECNKAVVTLFYKGVLVFWGAFAPATLKGTFATGSMLVSTVGCIFPNEIILSFVFLWHAHEQ